MDQTPEQADHYTRVYPEATASPCNECPWRRRAMRGWLGPLSAAGWIAVVLGEGAIACHKTIRDTNDEGHGDWDHPQMRQCRGAAIFRENLCKLPVNESVTTGPEDKVLVFASIEEFVDHHEGRY